MSDKEEVDTTQVSQEDTTELEETENLDEVEEVEEEIEEEEETFSPEDIEIETRKPLPQDKKEKEKEGEELEDSEEDFLVDKKTIDKIVEKKLEEAGVTTTRNQIEVDSYIRENPEFDKYRDVALKYMNHPAYSNIPVNNIMAIVASKDLQALGAKKERQAQKQAKATLNPGTTARKVKTSFDWENATEEEYRQQRARIFGQPM